MTNSDNPYAPNPGMQMSGSVSYGAKPAETPTSSAPAAAGAGSPIIDTTTADFTRDVIQASRNQPVLVDFWAPWCGPCKQLTPVLERVVTEAKGKVRLVKLNIDDHPAIPGQMGIQSIPAVVAFVDGRPVDGFMGALPESQVRDFVAKIAAAAGPDAREAEIAAVLEQARAALSAGDINQAGEMFSAILEAEPEHAGAKAGLASAMVMAGALDEAEALIATFDEAVMKTPEAIAAKRQLDLAREVSGLGNPAELQARIAADGNDFEARLQLSKILNAQGDREGATDQLFAIMRKNRAWNDEAARKQLLGFFEAWGHMDEATLSARRQLSSLLFS